MQARDTLKHMQTFAKEISKFLQKIKPTLTKHTFKNYSLQTKPYITSILSWADYAY